MAMMELKIDTLNQLDDGRVVAAFMAELKRAVSDCDDRPADKKAREVTLTGFITPIQAPEGGLENVGIEFEVSSKVPKRKSRRYTMDVRKGGMLIFSSTSPDVRQPTFMDKDDE